jgi:hypothetical protein
VPVVKEMVLQGSDYYYRSSVGGIGQKMKVGVFVQFENREASRLGMPMPKGVVRVYKKDSAGNAQFIGEDAIDHTPKNESVRLKLGDAFDVTADKKQTDFKRRDAINQWSTVFESDCRGARAGAGRLDHARAVRPAHQGRGRNRGMENRRASGGQHDAQVPGIGTLLEVRA